MQQDLPSFDQPPETETPAPPKKPRQKPTRKRKARKVRAAAPVPKKTRRKRRTRVKIAPTKTHIKSGEPSMFAAFRHITAILVPFSKVERQELLQAFEDIVKEST